MTRFQQRPLVPLLTFLLILASVSVTRASSGPKWSDEQLIGFSNVILTGRVVDITEKGADDHINKLAKKYVNQDVYPYRQPGEVRVIYTIRPEHSFVMG